MSKPIEAILAGERLEVLDWGQGHGPMPSGWESWSDHGRRRELCRYCNGKHDFNECENEGDVKPGPGLVGMAEKWMKHTEALTALRAAAKAEIGG